LGATTASWGEFGFCARAERGAETANAANHAISVAQITIHSDFTGQKARTVLIVAILEPSPRAASAHVLASAIRKPDDTFYM
jgi:tRNA1(Val) A37 N6-methylase TrmN6